MSDIIHLLPDSIANQIAAGEVIQRPASAVKELMENSIDSGATEIKLIIKDAGKSYMQVIDNGCGMSETDARMSFERHATSKIKSIDDLFAIRTKGFRGEALASIAAVAQVELKSRRVEDELGTLIIIEDSEVKSQEPCQAAPGTSISVKNLFYNVPARRNFLKSNPVETRHIIEEFQRIALAHPNVFFSMHHNEMEVFHLKAGNLRQRIIGVFGNTHNEKIVPVEERTDFVSIYGLVGKPENAKKTRGEQYFFVNNRYIKNPYLNHAVFNNYEELVPQGSYPFFVLFIDIDPSRIDINVHPTKQEIKFDDEKVVYGFIRAAVKHALAKFSVTPSLDFEQEASMNRIQALGGPVSPTINTSNFEKFHNPFTKEKIQNQSLRNWGELYEVVKSKEANSAAISNELSVLELGDEVSEKTRSESEPHQLHKQYIVSPIKSGFIVIDQQAAHERILFEKYLTTLVNNAKASQQQLFPQTVHCTVDDAQLLKEILPEVNALGFDVQDFGNNSFVVHGIPADINGGDESSIIEKLLENYKNNLSVLKLEKRECVARSLAQQTSIKPGQKLSVKEMQTLIDELFACEQPYQAPNKKFTFVNFNFDELEKRFSKPGS